MKVQVNLKCSKLETAANGALSISVSLDDTICAIKERLELIEPAAALTGARLVYQEKELDNDMRLADCGIKEGASLDLVVVAPAEDFAQQLAELLKARDLPLEELSLLYSHRYGATTGQVLKLLGRDAKLPHFLRECKQFVVEGSLARLASPPLKPPGAKLQHIPEEGQKPGAKGAKVSVSVRLLTPAGEVVTNVGLTIGAADTVVDVKDRVVESEMIPFADREMIFNGETLEDSRRLMDCRIHKGSCVELVVRATEQGLAAQLAELLRGREQRASSPDELSLLFCYRYGTPVARALKLLGLKDTVRGFIKRQEEFVLDNGCVTLASVNADRALDAILEAASFLNMHKVDRSIKGTSAKATIRLAGLPSKCTERYMPRLLQSVAAGLQERLEGQAFSAIDVSGDAVQVTGEDGAVHQLRFEPVAQ